MKRPTFVKTRRLILKPQSVHDFDRFFAMSKDPEVMKYIGDGSIFAWNRQTALIKFNAQIRAPKQDGVGTLAVYRRRDQRYLGWCAVAPSRVLQGLELGYRLCRDSWGRGYATEAAHAVLKRAFEQPHVDRILACTHPGNAASIRVLHKLGFILAYGRHSKPIGKEMPVYVLCREDFV